MGVIQAYFDDSGVKGTDSVFVLAGFIAKAEDWAPFSMDRDVHLRAEPSVKYLKMNEAAKLKGQFHRWNAAVRDQKLLGCVAILKRLASKVIYSAIDLGAHFDLHAEGPMKDPYFLGFYAVLLAACAEAQKAGHDSVEVFFDEHSIFQGRIKKWYPVIKDAIEREERTHVFASILPIDLMFKQDLASPPLQAGDIMAWLLRHTFSGKRTSFDWIASELSPTIPVSAASQTYTRDHLKAIQQMSESYSFSQEFIEKWRHHPALRPRKK